MKQTLFYCVMLISAMCGCGKQQSDEGSVDKTRAKLQAISGAYMTATMKTERAPAKPDDLLPFLGDATTSEEQKRAKLRSDNDGEDFVIAWGVDFRKQRESGLLRDAIFAYEKRGKGGQRYVLKLPTDIFIIPDDVFQKSQFHEGYQPNP